jgi:hypothetical protein
MPSVANKPVMLIVIMLSVLMLSVIKTAEQHYPYLITGKLTNNRDNTKGIHCAGKASTSKNLYSTGSR